MILGCILGSIKIVGDLREYKVISKSGITENQNVVCVPGQIDTKHKISYIPKIEKIVYKKAVIKNQDVQDYGKCTEKGPTYWKSYLSNLKGATETEKQWLIRIATCESHLHNCSKNKRSSASGLFQYLTSTYRSATKHLSNPPSIWDGEFQTKLALNAYRGGQANAWVCN